MKTNEELQQDVEDAIKWEPSLNAAEIGVTAKDGIVTLTGIVNSYAKKLEAEDAAKNVAGVKAMVEKIDIKFGVSGVKNDNDVASEVVNAFKLSWEVPEDNLKVKVEHGWVSLAGDVEWNYQKEAAKKAIKNLAGVKGVTNNITIKSESLDEIERKDIERAFVRSWAIDNRDIQVEVSGNRVTLNGTVNSLYQKDEAGRIAWNAPGVWSVDNELVVDHVFA